MAAKVGKNHQAATNLVDKGKAYQPKEGIALAKQASHTKFDETVELHMKMGLDPRHADQQVRGVALLPNGLGKQIRVLVFAQGEAERVAQEAGAEFVGSDELIRKIEDGWVDFDVAVATPDMMGRVGRLGRVLGRRGLMPNPRSGTVVPMDDLPRVIRDARKGRVEFRLDRTAIIHVPIGKVSFDEDSLMQNLASIVDSVVKAKPTGAKGQYIQSLSLCTTMGPGIKLDIPSAMALAAED